MQELVSKLKFGIGAPLKAVAVGNIFQQQVVFAMDFSNSITELEDLAYAVMQELPDTIAFPEELGLPEVAEIPIDNVGNLFILPILSAQAAIFLLVDPVTPSEEICKFLEDQREYIENYVENRTGDLML